MVIKLLGIPVVKVDQVTVEWIRIPMVTVWEYVLSEGSQNNKKRRKTTRRRRGRGKHLQLHHQKQQMQNLCYPLVPQVERKRTPLCSESQHSMLNNSPFRTPLYRFFRLLIHVMTTVSHKSPAFICRVIHSSTCSRCLYAVFLYSQVQPSVRGQTSKVTKEHQRKVGIVLFQNMSE